MIRTLRELVERFKVSPFEPIQEWADLPRVRLIDPIDIPLGEREGRPEGERG